MGEGGNVVGPPRIIDLLRVQHVPRFAILGYADFVGFAATCAVATVPEVSSVLHADGEPAFVVVVAEQLAKAVKAWGGRVGIDEAAYVSRYPDVGAAVAAGKLRNASEHFFFQGYLEGREARYVA